MRAFALEPEQQQWCEELRTLAVERFRPLAERHRDGAGVNRALVAALGEAGLLERVFPADGRPAAAMDLCLLRESLAHGCTEAETALALQGLGA
jgi:hypothetical protein